MLIEPNGEVRNSSVDRRKSKQNTISHRPQLRDHFSKKDQRYPSINDRQQPVTKSRIANSTTTQYKLKPMSFIASDRSSNQPSGKFSSMMESMIKSPPKRRVNVAQSINVSG